MEIIQAPSPNYNIRALPISMLLLHYTGMQSGQAALQRLTDAQSNVSAHYLVDEDGRIFALVDEANRAWHGGTGSWRGITDINSASIGIEIVNPGHEWGYRAFPQAQMDAVIQLSQAILNRHAIPAHNIIGHSDSAPTRKQDPGELFDWKLLADNDIGQWYAPTTAQASAVQLADYGYDITHLEQAIIAFQRHFRPDNLSGIWDDECAEILASLLNQA